MKKLFVVFVCSCAVIFSVVTPSFAVKYDWYGYVRDGRGSPDTSAEKIYEYGEGNDDGTDYYYCFHAAMATAVNIRLGESKVTLDSVHKTFYDYFPGYRANTDNGGNREANLGMFRMLTDNSSAIPDLKAVLRRISVGDASALFAKIKDAVQRDNPVVIAAKKYLATEPDKYRNLDDSSFSAVYDFSGDVGHALVIVGYIENLDSNNVKDNLVAIRDPYLKRPFNSVRYKWFYDYTIPVRYLMDYIQKSEGGSKYHLMLFKTEKDSNLKTLVPTPTNNEFDSYSGYLSSKKWEYQPNGTYYHSSQSGTHSARLEGPSNSDFDLYLYKWNGSSWKKVESSILDSSSESIDYDGSSGYYKWRVYSYSGSGNYELSIKKP